MAKAFPANDKTAADPNGWAAVLFPAESICATMTIGVFQDLHANLPALKKAIEFFQQEGCTKMVHVGDLVGIGPFPRECMELAKSTPEMAFVLGNHDHWYAYGLPSPIPSSMSRDEQAHQAWTQEQIGAGLRGWVRSWPFTITHLLGEGMTVAFQHYGLDHSKQWFSPIVKNPGIADLDALFIDLPADFIFYGHHHQADDQQGQSRYINLGSAGCYDRPEVRLALIKVTDEEVTVEKHTIPYEDGNLMAAFDERKVPAREFIRKVFIVRD